MGKKGEQAQRKLRRIEERKKNRVLLPLERKKRSAIVKGRDLIKERAEDLGRTVNMKVPYTRRKKKGDRDERKKNLKPGKKWRDRFKKEGRKGTINLCKKEKFFSGEKRTWPQERRGKLGRRNTGQRKRTVRNRGKKKKSGKSEGGPSALGKGRGLHSKREGNHLEKGELETDRGGEKSIEGGGNCQI